MLRLAAILVLLSTAAMAQRIGQVESSQVGTGCIGERSAIHSKIETCLVTPTKTRVWCPNGSVFERMETAPAAAVLRSLCEINQTL